MNQKKDIIFISLLTLLTVATISLTTYFIVKNEKIQQNVKAVSQPTPTPLVTTIPTNMATPSSTLVPTQ